MDVVYLYHHPDQIPTPPRDQDRGGFLHPLELVIEGWSEWQKTGRIPDREELARRLVKSWVDDLRYFDALIERGKPKQEAPAPPDNHHDR